MIAHRFLRGLLLALFAPLAAHALSPQASLGRAIFFDASLSASGKMSCATCHSPAHAYGPPNARAVQLGGVHLDLPGTRAVPSLRYTLNRTPVWTHVVPFNPAEKYVEGEEPPSGGFGWDGRFNTLHEQAAFPLLAPTEMGNASPADFTARLARAPYAAAFAGLFGKTILQHPPEAFDKARLALERFLLEDPSFHPYTSKYDAYLDGRATLSPAEQRGLALFDDPARGGCALCHLDQKGVNGAHPLFTDYQYEVLAVPRNPEIPANRAPGYYDLGLCGPLRTDQAGERKFCGMFKTPTLRNVAVRGAFFHNGRFHTLIDALRFYVRRDTNPHEWYGATKFDDLPPQLRRNVDVSDPPLTQHEGQAPIWNEAEIRDVAAFLATLTDADARPPVPGGQALSVSEEK